MSESYKCPYCDLEVNEEYKLKNHIRQSKGNGHGPYGEYPPDYKKEDIPDPIQAREWVPLTAFDDGAEYIKLGYSEINIKTKELR